MKYKGTETVDLADLDLSIFAGQPLDENRVAELVEFQQTGDINVLSPMTVFAKWTRLGDGPEAKETKAALVDYFFDRGYVPFIDYNKELEGWVLHSLAHGQQGLI